MTLRILYVLLLLKRAWRLVNCKRGVPDAPELCARRKKKDLKKTSFTNLSLGEFVWFLKSLRKTHYTRREQEYFTTTKMSLDFQLNNIY